METNKKDPEAVRREIQDLKNKAASLENKITTMQHIAARFSMRCGEDDETVDRLENDIDELNKQIEYLTNSGL